MIVRWYMALSEFGFSLEFMPGVIADSLSRLCRRNNMNIHQNISYQLFILSHINRVPLNIPKLAYCTTPFFAIYGLERTLKGFKDLKDTWEYQRQHI